ncbi:MAG: hypothetical protein N2316_12735, partial [Spirochaetes bacterium]|nr:hypothetical protein [Spirochaetota bacterium]
MRNAFMLCIIIAIELIFTSSIYPLPLVGIAGIATQNPRTKMFATLIESHLDNILRLNFITSAEVFEPINSLLLREQLANFNCKEESCLYRYAMNAHISVIILGSVEQRSYSIVLTLSAFGTDVPYFGKTIYKYTASIPTHGFSFTLREHSYIFEEHCARFIAGLLKRYKKPVFIRFQNNQPSLNPSLRTNGIFTAYRPTIGFATKTPKHTPFMQYIPIGTVSIRNGILTSFTPLIKEGDFILVDYSHVADEIYEFYYGRKRELVFSPPNYNDSLFTMIYTPLASLTMPIVSPFLGYLANRDYSGLGLWCINFA